MISITRTSLLSRIRVRTTQNSSQQLVGPHNTTGMLPFALYSSLRIYICVQMTKCSCELSNFPIFLDPKLCSDNFLVRAKILSGIEQMVVRNLKPCMPFHTAGFCVSARALIRKMVEMIVASNLNLTATSTSTFRIQ